MGANTDIGLSTLGERYERCFGCLEEARSGFMRVGGVLGVGIGPKEINGLINASEPCLIVYVEKKRSQTELNAGELMPREYRGVKVDVVELGKRRVPIHNQFDAFWLTGPSSNDDGPQGGVGYVY